jgi:hypothetical protein
MVKNPKTTRMGLEIFGGVPHHVDVVYRKEPRIWYAEVNDEKGDMMDMARNEYDMFQTYVEDNGNKIDAIRSGMAIGEHHGIPVNIISGGRVMKTIKPPGWR